jgi:hypothetical protein
MQIPLSTSILRIDDLHGAGATKNKQTEKRLKKSAQVRAAKEALNELVSPGSSDSLTQAMLFLHDERRSFSVDIII